MQSVSLVLISNIQTVRLCIGSSNSIARHIGYIAQPMARLQPPVSHHCSTRPFPPIRPSSSLRINPRSPLSVSPDHACKRCCERSSPPSRTPQTSLLHLSLRPSLAGTTLAERRTTTPHPPFMSRSHLTFVSLLMSNVTPTQACTRESTNL